MTPASASAACLAAGLTVRSVEVVGRQVCVVVSPPNVQPETYIGKLAARGLACTVAFSGGETRLWFAAAEGEA